MLRVVCDRALLLVQQADLTADLATQRRRDQEAVTQRWTQLQRRQQELKEIEAQVAANSRVVPAARGVAVVE